MKSQTRLILGGLLALYSIIPVQAQKTTWQKLKEPIVAATMIIGSAAGCALSNYCLEGKYNLLNAIFWPLVAGLGYCLIAPAQEKQTEQENSIIDQSTFESYKAQLPTSLKAFVADFETWSKEDKAKVSIHGLSFMISDLRTEKHAPYEGSIGFWIDCRTQTQKQRALLIECLRYLQQL